MSAIYRITEEGREICNTADLYNNYYLLKNDELVEAKAAIGFCEDCATYSWIEDLDWKIDEECDITKHILKSNPQLRKQWVRTAEFLKARLTPPRCLGCSGLRVVRLEWLAEETINPANGKKYKIENIGMGCFLPVAPVFLNEHGVKLKLPEERISQLEEKLVDHL